MGHSGAVSCSTSGRNRTVDPAAVPQDSVLSAAVEICRQHGARLFVGANSAPRPQGADGVPKLSDREDSGRSAVWCRQASPPTVIGAEGGDSGTVPESEDTVSFSAITDAALEKAGCPKPPGYRGLNLESANRDDIKGNETLEAWRALGAEWAARFTALDTKTQVSLINFLADTTPEIFVSEDWLDQLERFKGKTAQETAEKRAKHQPLIAFVEDLRHHEKFNRLSVMGFPSGRASYSVKALNRLAATMAEQNCDEESAITLCYPRASTRRAEGAAPVLPSVTSLAAAPPTGNATVDMALGQIRIAVNEIIAELGRPPSEIIIEMARDMSLGPKGRKEREKDIGKNQKSRTEAKLAILKHNLYPYPSRILKYQSWQEQKAEFCPYCEQNISFEQAMSADTEIEHILPKKLTQVRRKSSELVLAHRNCNAEKGDPHALSGLGQYRQVRHRQAARRTLRRHQARPQGQAAAARGFRGGGLNRRIDRRLCGTAISPDRLDR